MMKWGSLAVAVLLVMLVMWFCVPAGFIAGAGRRYRALAVVGVFFLRAKPAPEH